MSIKNMIKRMIPDKLFLELYFNRTMGKKLNLKNPQTFNEKLQWLKLHDRKPEYVQLVDKVEAKRVVSERIGGEYIIPTLGVWERFDEIDFAKLPDQFVLKCTHDSGSVVVCKDKDNFDQTRARAVLEKGLKGNYYWRGREWPYKNVPHRIIAEKYMADSQGKLVDYKFFCFNGVVDSVMLCLDRETGDTKFYFFDREWNLKRYNKRGKAAPEGFTLPKPEGMDEMFTLAEKLCQGIPYVRVDLYNLDGMIYFGEMTFFPAGGFDANLLPETDALWGDMLVLPKIQ